MPSPVTSASTTALIRMTPPDGVLARDPAPPFGRSRTRLRARLIGHGLTFEGVEGLTGLNLLHQRKISPPADTARLGVMSTGDRHPAPSTDPR